jgi:hypothetical protein
MATLALYLVLALIYNLATPIFEASDEYRHYLVIRYLQQKHELPVLQPSDDPFAPWQEAGQPPLYYLAGALLTSWVDTGDLAQIIDFNPHAEAGIPSASPDNKNLFVHSPAEDFPYHGVSLAAHLVRLLSVLLGAGAILMTYALARVVAPGAPLAGVLAAALVAFNPQFLFVAASVDNDILVDFVSTAALLVMAHILVSGVTARRLWLLSGLLGAAALSKLSGLGLPPLAAIAVGAQTLKTAGRRKVLERLAALAVGPLAIAGWWYVRNWLVYGEPTGLRAWGELITVRSPDALQLVREIPGLFMSYWAVFGAFDIRVAGWVYLFYLAVTVAGLAGLWLARQRLPPARLLALLAGWFAIELAALARWTTIASASSGRLLFTAIAPAAILLALGLLKPLRPAWRIPATAGLASTLVVLAAWLPFRYIFPAYERPVITGSPAGQPSHTAAITYGGKLALLGYDLSRPSARPGEDVELRLYWQVADDVDRNYSVTVQLLTADGVAGQYDSFPGQGRIATRHLRRGEYFRDTYRVRVSPEARPPKIARLKVGLYEDSLAKVPAVDAAGAELAEPVIGELEIAGDSPPGGEPLATLGGELELLGGSPDRQAVAPGEVFEVRLRWRAGRRMSQPYTIFVHLADAAGRPVAQHDAPPREGAFPTTWWAAGEVVEDTVRLAVPAQTPAGEYQLLVGAYEQPSLRRLELSAGGDAYVLGRVDVRG